MSMPEYPPPEPKKNRTLIIVAVVVAVLCCCWVGVLAIGWNFGDQLIQSLGIQL
jgi:hypothetical protein